MDIETKMKNLTQQLVNENPELGETLKQVEGKSFEEQITALVPILMGISENIDLASMMQANDIIYTNEQGTERLNPKYESYLAERLQFDGDAPELRTGALPRDQKPAVPVDTRTRNPARLGQELTEASEKIYDQFRSLEGQSTALTTQEPEGYKRGQLPVPQEVNGLTAQEYFALSIPEKKEHTWRFISTTQGRVSAVPIIADVLLETLKKKGHTVRYGEGDVLVRESHWTLSLTGGANSTQSNFSYIDIVARAFFREYEGGSKTRSLTIVPINRVADRIFGWKMLLWDRL